MAHAAATYAESVKQWTSPAEEAAANAADVAAAQVKYEAGEDKSEEVYQDLTRPVPTIVSIAPPTSVAGTGTVEVTVTGTNFSAGDKLVWAGVEVATVVVSPTSITATVPLLAAAGDVTFHVSGGPSRLSNVMTYTFTAAVVAQATKKAAPKK